MLLLDVHELLPLNELLLQHGLLQMVRLLRWCHALCTKLHLTATGASSILQPSACKALLQPGSICHSRVHRHCMCCTP